MIYTEKKKTLTPIIDKVDLKNSMDCECICLQGPYLAGKVMIRLSEGGQSLIL